MNRVGKFPIFANQTKLGELADTSGSIIPKESLAFYLNNKLAYDRGFKKLDVKSINGMFHFITNGLSELFTKGIPPFTLNIAYPKGAVVSFNGSLFISKSDNNTTHVSQLSHWGKIKVEDRCDTEKKTDDSPIGTILTVPITSKREGYIDYVEGQKFNPAIYPDLYKALGTDKFSISNSINDSNSLPIGSCIHILSANPNVPDTYIEWKPYTSLVQYPELKRELELMAQRISDLSIRSLWLNALENNQLPYYTDFYLGIGEAGLMKEDSIRMTELVTAPVVIDNSNTLNPMGITRCVAEKNTYPVVANQDVSRSNISSSYLVTGQYADQYNPDVDKRLFNLAVGQGDVTKPRTLSTRIFVKATNPRPSAISSTHKQIIKAVE